MTALFLCMNRFIDRQ